MKPFIIFLLLVNAACSSSKNAGKTTNAISHEEVKANSTSKNLLAAGIDFIAEGNEPTNWRLTMNYDDTVRFIADDGLLLKFAFNRFKKSVEKDKTIFAATINAGTVEISIINKSCTITPDSQVFTKEVTFLFNTILYKGCGKFLVSELLEGKWELEKIGNETIQKNEYNQLPTFEFKMNKNYLMGNDGCNNFSGQMEIVGKRIQFYEVISATKSCNKKSIKDIINKKIVNQLVDYYFKDGKLYLYLIDDSILIFKK